MHEKSTTRRKPSPSSIPNTAAESMSTRGENLKAIERKRNSSPSRRALQVATEKTGRKLMTEDEVSDLVHNALMRARQATSSFSPRTSPRHNTIPRSPTTPSTHSVSSPRHEGSSSAAAGKASTSMRPPQNPSSPKSRVVGERPSPYLPHDEEIAGGRSSLSQHGSGGGHSKYSSRSNTTTQSQSYHTAKTRYSGGARTRAIEGGGGEDNSSSGNYNWYDDFTTPDASEGGSMDFMDLGNLSMASTDVDVEGNAPSITSVNSSEAIIRKVEEEIANARRAAQEANRRLAGVTANLSLDVVDETTVTPPSTTRNVEQYSAVASPSSVMSANTASVTSAPVGAASSDEGIGMISESREQASPTFQDQSRSASDGANTVLDEQDLFDSAMNVIGEEFDMMDDTLGRHNLSNGRLDESGIFNMNDAISPGTVDDRANPFSIDLSVEGSILDTLLNPFDMIAASARPQEKADEQAGSGQADESVGGNEKEDIVGTPTPIDCTNIPDDGEEDVILSPSEEIDSLLKGGSSENDDFSLEEEQLSHSGEKLQESHSEELHEQEDAGAEINAIVFDDYELEIRTNDIQKEETSASMVVKTDDDNNTDNNDANGVNASKSESLVSAALGMDMSHDEADHGTEIVTTNASIESGAGGPQDEEKNDEENSWIPIGGDESADMDASRGMEPVAEVARGNSVEEPFDEKDDPKSSNEFKMDNAQEETTVDRAGDESTSPGAEESVEAVEHPESFNKDENDGDVLDDGNTPDNDGNTPDDNLPDLSKSDSQVFIYQVKSAGSADAVATARMPLPKDDSEDPEAIEVVAERIEEVMDGNENAYIVRMNSSEEKRAKEAKDDGEEDTGADEQEDEIDDRKEDASLPAGNGTDSGVLDTEAENESLPTDVASFEAEHTSSHAQQEVSDEKTKQDEDTPESEVGPQVDDDTNAARKQITKEVNDCVEEIEKDEKQIPPQDDSEHTDRNQIEDEEKKVEPNTIECNEIQQPRPLEEGKEPPPAVPSSGLMVDSPPAPQQAEITTNDTSKDTPISKRSPSPAPSPRRVAMVEHRRAVESRVNNARNAMCGEPGMQTPDRAKGIINRSQKVKFKQRYPVPPPMKKPRQPSEIIMGYRVAPPTEKLYQAKPKKDLKELLEAATGSSLPRRSNACGALKVLSTQKKNKFTLVRTKGFLDALVFAIQDDFANNDAEAGIAARSRAVNVVLNVSEVKDNRHYVLNHPGMADALVKCMVEDKGEGRALACAALATLAKSAHCREPMAKTEKLVDVLAIILKGEEPSMFGHESSSKTNQTEGYTRDEKKDAVGDDDATATVMSGDTYSSGSTATDRFSANPAVGSKKEMAMKRQARMNACAAVLHLSKECSISQMLGASGTLKYCLVAASKESNNPIHTKCLEILCHMTRFPHNNAVLVKYPGLVETLAANGQHEDDTDRLWSMRTLQNLSSDPSGKSVLAHTTVLEVLSTNMMRQKYEEQLAATAALYNISTEPGAVVPLTNTRNVVATLVHLAHSPMSETIVRSMACEALATLGLWLQTLSGAGTVPDDITAVPLPSYITTGWKRWEA